MPYSATCVTRCRSRILARSWAREGFLHGLLLFRLCELRRNGLRKRTRGTIVLRIDVDRVRTGQLGLNYAFLVEDMRDT